MFEHAWKYVEYLPVSLVDLHVGEVLVVQGRPDAAPHILYQTQCVGENDPNS